MLKKIKTDTSNKTKNAVKSFAKGVLVLVIHSIPASIQVCGHSYSTVFVVLVTDTVFLITVKCGQSVCVKIHFCFDFPVFIIGPANQGITVVGDNRIQLAVQIGRTDPPSF